MAKGVINRNDLGLKKTKMPLNQRIRGIPIQVV